MDWKKSSKKDEESFGKAPVLKKGKFVLDFPGVINEFEHAMQKFPVKRVLYQTVFQGRGLEFDSYRRVEPGDDAGSIDWKASLRASSLLARKYIEERNLNVYFLVDVSNSMLFGSQDKLKAEYASEFIAALSHLIISSGDRAGLVMFNEDIVKILHPSNNRTQFPLFTKFLSDVNLYGGGFDLASALEHVIRTIDAAYTVFIIVSDFIQTPKRSHKILRLMGTKFETIAVMIRDPADEILPRTHYQLAIQDPYSKKQMVLDPDIASNIYAKNSARQKGILKDVFKESSIDFFELRSDKHFAIPFATFLKSRASGGRV